jgi:hypothetical protein
MTRLAMGVLPEAGHSDPLLLAQLETRSRLGDMKARLAAFPTYADRIADDQIRYSPMQTAEAWPSLQMNRTETLNP